MSDESESLVALANSRGSSSFHYSNYKVEIVIITTLQQVFEN